MTSELCNAETGFGGSHSSWRNSGHSGQEFPQIRKRLEDLQQLIRNGEENIGKFLQQQVDSIQTARDRHRDFYKFYTSTLNRIEDSREVLSRFEKEESDESIIEMATNLQRQLTIFTSRLEDTREKIDDITRCYEILDQINDWCEDATRLAAGFSKTETSGTAKYILEQLDKLLDSRDRSLDMKDFSTLSRKMENSKLKEKCRAAEIRCGETADLLKQQRKALEKILKENEKEQKNPGTCGQRGSFEVRGSDAYSSGNSISSFLSSSSSCKTSVSCGNQPNTSLGNPPLMSLADTKRSSKSTVILRRRTSAGLSNSHLMGKNTDDVKYKSTIHLIIEEMLQTERDYVNSLEYIIKNYIPELSRPDIPQALRGKRNIIFGNIEKIFEFHSLYFLRELENSIETPFLIGNCFLKYENSFYLYALYNKNKPKSDAIMTEYGTHFFRKKQFELGDKMDLGSYLLKPVQRMGKYALLLKQLIKESASKEHQEVSNLVAAEQMVRFQLRHGNDLLAMDSLRNCDVNLKEQGRLLRQNEFVVWRQKRKKSFRHIFLFEDLILFSKAKRDIYVYKQSMKTADIGFTAQVGDSATKFEIWFRKRKPNETFILEANCPEVKNAWTEELSRMLWKQALRSREMRMAEMVEMGVGNKPCLEIRPSQDRISDRSISCCQLPKVTKSRYSMGGSDTQEVWGIRRPHSILSINSSGGSSASSGSDPFNGTLVRLRTQNSGSNRVYAKTVYSLCSAESGIFPDLSPSWDESESSRTIAKTSSLL